MTKTVMKRRVMNGKRILMVANAASMMKLFNMHNIKILQSLGYQVYVAANFSTPGTISHKANSVFKQELKQSGVKYFNVKFERGIGNPVANRKVFRQLCDIVDQYHIQAIHTHAPLSSVISRQVAHHKHIKCIYTSHGFQFFKGGPLKNWVIFYPVERYYARWTDALITINSDDYRQAKKMPVRDVFYIPGIGTNIKQALDLPISYRHERRQKTRQALRVTDRDFLVLSVGELSVRKNHATILKAIAKLNNPCVKYVIAGIGPEHDHLLQLAQELGISSQIKLLGFRNDVQDLYLAADLNAFISRREGLGMGGLDGVALGTYTIASAITGAKDYIKDEKTGILINNPTNVDEVVNAMAKVITHHLCAQPDRNFLMKFDQSNVDQLMTKIYQRELN